MKFCTQQLDTQILFPWKLEEKVLLPPGSTCDSFTTIGPYYWGHFPLNHDYTSMIMGGRASNCPYTTDMIIIYLTHCNFPEILGGFPLTKTTPRVGFVIWSFFFKPRCDPNDPWNWCTYVGSKSSGMYLKKINPPK